MQLPFHTDIPAIIGMIHVPALPGTPKASLSPEQITAQCMQEALKYKEAGIDAIAIENMHDTPYLNRHVGPEITALMSLIGYEVKRATGLPTGIQILAGANKEALAVAHAAGLDFIRAEGFVFSHIADEGLMNSDAGELLRYRKQIGAEHIAVFTDIKKKHSAHAITADVSLEETAKAAEFFMSDGIIVTGISTGEPASIQELQQVREKVSIPVLVGSGVNLENVESYLEVCDGLIIGSWFKKDGYWANSAEREKVERLMNKVRKFRESKNEE